MDANFLLTQISTFASVQAGLGVLLLVKAIVVCALFGFLGYILFPKIKEVLDLDKEKEELDIEGTNPAVVKEHEMKVNAAFHDLVYLLAVSIIGGIVGAFLLCWLCDGIGLAILHAIYPNYFGVQDMINQINQPTIYKFTVGF